MMIRPAVLPDEVARGYLGRIMRLNGWTKIESALHELKRCSSMHSPSDPERTPADRLAHATGLTAEQFIRHHSLAPYIRAFVPSERGARRPRSHDQEYSFLRVLGLGVARKDAHLCPLCVREDLAFHGVSYWRRSHQLPGIYWCSKHGCALRHLRADVALHNSPAHVLDRSTAMDEDWVQAQRSNPWIHRFHDISVELARGEPPLDLRDASELIRHRIIDLGYGTTDQLVDVPAVFDALHRHFGERWLCAIMPRMKMSRFNSCGGKALQLALRGNRPAAPTVVYAVLMSLFFKSADQAMAAMRSCRTRRVRQINDKADSCA